MDHIQVVAILLLSYCWLNLKFTLKYTIVGGEGEILNFYKGSKLILLVTQELMQSFKIIALFLLGYFWLNLDFTPKYTVVGGQGGY